MTGIWTCACPIGNHPGEHRGLTPDPIPGEGDDGERRDGVCRERKIRERKGPWLTKHPPIGSGGGKGGLRRI